MACLGPHSDLKAEVRFEPGTSDSQLSLLAAMLDQRQI